MNFCCPPPKLSLRSTQGLAYDSDSWWSNRLAELNSLAMSWVRGQEHENKNFWYSIPMGESPIFLIELLITKLTRQVCIINTYSTYRTSSICIHTATSPPQAPFAVSTIAASTFFVSLLRQPTFKHNINLKVAEPFKLQIQLWKLIQFSHGSYELICFFPNRFGSETKPISFSFVV